MSESSFDVHKKYNQLLELGTIIFGFIGSADEMDVDKMIASAEKKLADALRLRKRLINILVESAQNLKLYHCRACAAAGNHEMFLVAAKHTDRLFFYTGNYILKSDFNTIESRIKMINGLPKEQLNGLYRGILDYGSISDEGGAGLGFIEIARKSDSPLNYELHKINDNTDFFTLEIALNV